MSGVSPQVTDMRKRMADRIERKKKELKKLRAHRDVILTRRSAEDMELSLTAVQIDGIEVGIAEDEAFLANAVPKKPRTPPRKATARGATLENQLDAGATAGGK